MKYSSIPIIVLLVALSACSGKKEKQVIHQEQESKLEILASSDKQWTGVAVSNEGRIFVNYPKWSKDVPVSVAELIEGEAYPYPNTTWNDRSSAQSFVAVQSVVVDANNRLWVLDTRNPQFQGVLEGGPILYRFNTTSNKMEKAYSFSSSTYTSNSYFNDVRIDTEKEVAYMTDSGNGALIVLDLSSGKSKRVLDHHYSTESEVDSLVCDGIIWKNTVHSDGIALSPDKQYLYYIALTGHTLYRIATDALMDSTQSDELLAQKVEKVASIPATDGMMFDTKGNLWLGGLEDNSINRLNPKGEVEKVATDERIRWADSFAVGADGTIYFTTSQIHLPNESRKAYQVIKLLQ